VKVWEAFAASGGTYRSPRVLAQLRQGGERVSKKTVEASMARQGLVARPRGRFSSLTRPDRRVAAFVDLVRRDFKAGALTQKWCGDLTEIPTAKASCIWPRSRTWPAGGWSASPSANTTTPSWPTRR
jgi:putative transposase